MSVKRYVSIVVLLLLSACANILPQEEPFPPEFSGSSLELTELDVLALAKAAAQRRGLNLSEYEAQDVLRSNDSWYVFFESKSAALGGHFSVAVDGTRKTTFFSPGR